MNKWVYWGCFLNSFISKDELQNRVIDSLSCSSYLEEICKALKQFFLSWQNLELKKGDTIYALFEWTVLTAVKVKINEIVSKVHYEPNKIFWYFKKIQPKELLYFSSGLLITLRTLIHSRKMVGDSFICSFCNHIFEFFWILKIFPSHISTNNYARNCTIAIKFWHV